MTLNQVLGWVLTLGTAEKPLPNIPNIEAAEARRLAEQEAEILKILEAMQRQQEQEREAERDHDYGRERKR